MAMQILRFNTVIKNIAHAMVISDCDCEVRILEVYNILFVQTLQVIDVYRNQVKLQLLSVKWMTGNLFYIGVNI